MLQVVFVSNWQRRAATSIKRTAAGGRENQCTRSSSDHQGNTVVFSPRPARRPRDSQAPEPTLPRTPLPRRRTGNQ